MTFLIAIAEESGDCGKSRKRVENKRHTNTHQPYTSALPTET
jgi:hypothetical protein